MKDLCTTAFLWYLSLCNCGWPSMLKVRLHSNIDVLCHFPTLCTHAFPIEPNAVSFIIHLSSETTLSWPWWSLSLSQEHWGWGNTQGTKYRHTHTWKNDGKIRLANPSTCMFFGRWEETWESGRNPHRHRKNTEIVTWDQDWTRAPGAVRWHCYLLHHPTKCWHHF